MQEKKILIVVGTRPNFMKASPLVKVLKKHSKFKPVLVHTGQHYDTNMSDSFFKDLSLPEPDVHLGVGSGSHAEQTGKIMIEFERICLLEKPDVVIVVGDVNSTIACALVAAKFCIPIAHIESGLRSFDRTMPEEINRLLTDQISDYLFTSCEDANQNLINEGIPENKIFFVGNVMIDSLLSHIKIAQKSNILQKLGLKKNKSLKKFAVLTLHRPSNVDNPDILKGILNILNSLSKKIPIIFPSHPRTVKLINKFKLTGMIHYTDNISPYELKKTNQKILATPPLSYLDFLCLMSNAALVLTDSGGIQEETTILRVPCLTLRRNTERPITIKEGTNIVVGNDSDKITKTAIKVLKDGMPKKELPKYWDGKASERIIKILNREL